MFEFMCISMDEYTSEMLESMTYEDIGKQFVYTRNFLLYLNDENRTKEDYLELIESKPKGDDDLFFQISADTLLAKRKYDK